VVDKIIRKREQVRSDYGYEEIDDLIGIKIICPYLSSARQVSRWLCSNDNFGKVSAEGMEVRPDGGDIDEDTFETLLNAAKRKYGRGYRGIHFIPRYS
jgi:ppGpp synthetase/RelA/SpoT-type nucleotidyltranferase